jgi:hypothetical protein
MFKFELSELITSGRLFFSVSFIVFTFFYLLYKFGALKKSGWPILFIKNASDFTYRYCVAILTYIRDTVVYLYRRYYKFTFFYFFFKKLSSYPVDFILFIFRSKENLKKFLWHVLDWTVSIIVMAIMSVIHELIYYVPGWITTICYFITTHVVFTDYLESFTRYKRNLDYLNNMYHKLDAKKRDLFTSSVYCAGVSFANFFLCVIVVFFYLLWFAVPTFFVILAFSVFFWALLAIIFIVKYLRFIFKNQAFITFCKTQQLVFSKVSLLFVPVAAIAFKKKALRTDKELKRDEEYAAQGRKAFLDTLTVKHSLFELSEERENLREAPPTANRVFVNEGFLSTADLVGWLNKNNRNVFQEWVRLNASKKQPIPFVFIGSDSQVGAAEKGFTKLFWVNDLVVNKTFVNRLNYSVIESFDGTMLSDATTSNTVFQPIVYCEGSLLTAAIEKSFTVTDNLKISLCKSSIASWVDLDYDQYIKQFVLNRVFNKLKLQSLNGIGHSDQHLLLGTGVRSAVYKVYTPDFLVNQNYNFLNNPFRGDELFDLYSNRNLTKKGRILPLGKLTDIVLLLKSLRTLYQTLDCFSKTSDFEIEKTFKVSSLFKLRDKQSFSNLKELEYSLITKRFNEFCLASPFSFLPYSHIHHISYETRPDRFYLLPTSIDTITRAFLNRLIAKFVRQVNLSNFYLISREVQTGLGGPSRTSLPNSILSKLEYVLYKFFSNNENLVVNSNTQLFEDTQSFGDLKYEKSLHYFGLLNSFQKVNRLNDLLFVCDELFSSINFSLFGPKLLSLVYNPCYSSFLKLIINFKKLGNLESLQNCWFSLLYNLFTSEKIKSFNLVNKPVLGIYLLLLWRSVIKSIQASFSYFLPKTYLNQTYNYILTTDSLVKKVGGIDIRDRYDFGMTGLKVNNFLHPFTAVYNRNLMSVNLFALVDYKRNETNSESSCTGLEYNPNTFFDKTKTNYIWWWLSSFKHISKEERRYRRSVGDTSFERGDVFALVASNFLSLLSESYSGATSLDFLNFAALSYDPTGGLGSTNIAPTERFFLSEGITGTYSKYVDCYPAIDFVRQDILRRDLEAYAGSDEEFMAERIRFALEDEQERREEKAAGPIIADDFDQPPPEPLMETVDSPFYLEKNWIFGHYKWDQILTEDVILRPHSLLPRLEGADRAGFPLRYWYYGYYNKFLVRFFRAFSYVKYKRARLYYKTVALNPLTPLLYFFKKNKSVLFFKKSKKSKKVKRLSKRFFNTATGRRRKGIVRLKRCNKYLFRERVFVNKKFRRILFRSISNLFTKGKDNLILSDPHPHDPLGGPELRQRSLFRDLQMLMINNSQTKKELRQRSVISSKKRRLGLDQSFVNFSSDNADLKNFKVYSVMRPSLVKILRQKNRFKPIRMSNLEPFVRKNDLSNITRVGVGVSPFISKVAKVLRKTNQALQLAKRVKLNLTKIKKKRASSVLKLLRANALAVRYSKRIKRRDNRIRHFLTAGKTLIKHDEGTRYILGKYSRQKRLRTYGVVRSPRKHVLFKAFDDDNFDYEMGLTAKEFTELKEIEGLARIQKGQTVYPNSLELSKISNKLFGLSNLEKTKNIFETYFLSKNPRKVSFLKNFVTLPLLKKINLNYHKRLLQNGNSLLVDGQLQQLDNYSLFLTLLRLLKHKQDLHTFGKFKDIFLFKKLKKNSNFLYSEHSFEESFFTLLGQRAPLVQNPVLIKPISKSLVFDHNLLQRGKLPFLNKSDLFKKGKGLSFASNTVASLFFFNYVFLGKGVFFGDPIVNPKRLASTTTTIGEIFAYLKGKHSLTNVDRVIKNFLDLVNSKISFSPVEKKYKNTYRLEKILNRRMPSLRIITANKKAPFFVQWPFKVSKQLTESGKKKKRRLIETKEVKLLRDLFLFSKVRFLNSALGVFAPWSKSAAKRSPAVRVWNSLMNEKRFEGSSFLVNRSVVGDSTEFRKEVGRAITGVLLHKDSKEQFTGSKEMLSITEKMFSYYRKHFRFEPFLNWSFNTKKVLVYDYWKKFFEVSHFNLVLQKVRYLQQLKKNLIDTSIHHKFSPLSYDLRSQLPVCSFIRTRQTLKSNYIFRYKQKRIKPGSLRRQLRFLYLAHGELNFYKYNVNKIPIESVTFYKDRNAPELYKAYDKYPLDSITAEARTKFYKRKKLFIEYRVDRFLQKHGLVATTKNISTQSSFKRAVAAAIRFNALADEFSYNVLPLYSRIKLPWLSFDLNKLRVQLDVKKNRPLTRKFRVMINPSTNVNNEGVRKSKDLADFVDYFYEHERIFYNPDVSSITEFSNQSSNFERPGFKLSFVSELITRKLLINQENVPLWFLNWLQSEGYVLLHRYVAYKKHTHNTLSQVSHAPVPNSSGIEKLVAAFDLDLEDTVLYETLKKSFYKPLFSSLYAQHSTFSESVLKKNVPQTKNDYSKFVNEIPTVYDVLLSKAVRSFFMTQGVKKEIQKTSWHKTEYCRANRFGWLLPVWTLRTFKRLNILNFISLKKDIKFKNELGMNSLNKQLTINSADGYFYYLLLREKSAPEMELSPLFATGAEEPVFSSLNRPFNLLGQKAFSFDLKGFKSIFSKDDYIRFRNFLRWGKGYRYYWRKSKKKQKPLRSVQTKRFRQLRSTRFFIKNKYFLPEKRMQRQRNRSSWGSPHYCFLKSKRIWQNMFINFLFYIHIICYQRVLRRLASSWEVADSPLRYYSAKKRKISQEKLPNYFDHKLVANPDQTDAFSKNFADNIEYNSNYVSFRCVNKSYNKRYRPPLARDLKEDAKTPQQRYAEARWACHKLFEDLMVGKYFFLPDKEWEFSAGEDNRVSRFQFFSIQAEESKKVLRKRTPTFLYPPKARYVPQLMVYPSEQLPRTVRVSYFLQYKDFLKKQGRTYMTFLDRNFSRLRGSRLVRKGQRVYKRVLPLDNAVKIKKNPYEFNIFTSKKKTPPPFVLEKVHFPSKYDEDSISAIQYSKQKTHRDSDASFFSEKFQKERSVRLFGAIHNRALISKLELLKSGLTYQLDETLATSRRDPWEPKRPLLFLRYVNNFYFVRNSKFSRSITSLPALFSTKHLTVPFERFNHNDKMSFNKHVVYSGMYKRMRDKYAWTGDEAFEKMYSDLEQDPDANKEFKHTVSLSQDEQAYAERSFSYALTHLYGLHRPIFDISTLNNFLKAKTPTDLCAIRNVPWWIQRQEFRKKHMNFTKLDSVSSYRSNGRWGAVLKKIPYWKPINSEVLSHEPFVWFKRWFEDRLSLGVDYTRGWAQSISKPYRINRYRRFFRLHQIVSARQAFPYNFKNDTKSYWYDKTLVQGVKLPYRFSYFRENTLVSRSLEDLEPLSDKGSRSSSTKDKSSLLEFSLLGFLDYCISRGKLATVKNINGPKELEGELGSEASSDDTTTNKTKDSKEEKEEDLEPYDDDDIVIPPELEESSIIFKESKVFLSFDSKDSEVVGAHTKVELLEDFVFLNTLKEQKQKQKSLEFVNVCNVCIEDFFSLLNVSKEIQMYSDYFHNFDLNRFLRYEETADSIRRYMDIGGSVGLKNLLTHTSSLRYSEFFAVWIFVRNSTQRNYYPLRYNYTPKTFDEEETATTFSARRTNRKAFSLLFYVDESRNNNFTNKRAFTSFQVSKLATIFNYGSGLGLVNERRDPKVASEEIDYYNFSRATDEASVIYTTRAVKDGLFGGSSPDFLPVETKNQKRFFSFAWFFVSRSWSAIQSYGFYNYVSFSMNWLIPDGLYRMPFYIFNSCATMLVAPFENYFTRFMNTFTVVCFIFVFVISSLIIFLI